MSKKTFFIQTIVILLIVGMHLCSAETSAYQPKYQTIAHEILTIESEVLGTLPNYELLETLIDDVKQRITLQVSYSQDAAQTILQQIAAVLQQRNFYEDETILLTETFTPVILNDRAVFLGDCDTFSFLYLGIGEALGLPLRLVSLPQHTFIRWHFSNKTYLNWETTAPVSWTDAAYIAWYNMNHTPPLDVYQELKSSDRADIFAIVHYNLGNALTQQDDYHGAIEQYTQALAINPTQANAYYQRGNAWYVQGNDDMAIADFSRAIELNPHDVQALFLRGTSWYTMGEYDSAIADFNRTLQLDPSDVEALYLRGSAWYLQDNYANALADFSRALEMDPEFAEVYNDMAWLFATCPDDRYRDGKHALEFVQKAIELQPDARAYFLDTFAAAYAEIGNFEEAIKAQREALQWIQAEKTVENMEALSKYLQRLELYQSGQPYRE